MKLTAYLVSSLCRVMYCSATTLLEELTQVEISHLTLFLIVCSGMLTCLLMKEIFATETYFASSGASIENVV